MGRYQATIQVHLLAMAYIMMAGQPPIDVFDKKAGRALAKKRAERALIRYLYNVNAGKHDQHFGLLAHLYTSDIDDPYKDFTAFEYKIDLR